MRDDLAVAMVRAAGSSPLPVDGPLTSEIGRLVAEGVLTRVDRRATLTARGRRLLAVVHGEVAFSPDA